MNAMARITPEERATIIAVLTETENVSETARRTGRSTSAVSRLATAEGINVAQRPRTKRACESTKLDNAARRAQLAADLLADAQQLRAQLFKPAMAHNFGGKDNTFEEHEIPQPTFADQRNIMAACRLASTTSMDLERVDGSDDAQAKGLLERVVDGLERVVS